MSDVRYSYLHGPRRHVTIARSVDLEKNLVYCGISVCHPADVFRKALGRKIAEGRMERSNNLSWIIHLGDGGIKPLEAIIRYLSNPEEWQLPFAEAVVPTCVKELAQQWRLEKLKS